MVHSDKSAAAVGERRDRANHLELRERYHQYLGTVSWVGWCPPRCARRHCCDACAVVDDASRRTL